MMESRPRIAFILPCYNPQPGWEQILINRFSSLKDAFPNLELSLTLVNDGSNPQLVENQIAGLKREIAELSLISYYENKGKGYAVRKGVEQAQADYYIYTDIDLPYTLESTKAIYDKLAKGADVTVGIRSQKYYDKVPFRRMFISKALKKFIKLIIQTPITDTQCGLKGFNEKGKAVFLKTTIDRFLFDMEFIKLAFHTKGIKVVSQLVEPRPDIVFSEMNNKVLLREAFNFAKLIFMHNRKK